MHRRFSFPKVFYRVHGSENVSKIISCLMFSVILAELACAELMVGAAVVDVTPTQLPVLINGGMTTRSADVVNTPVNARAIVLGDGHESVGIVVVDSCMMPRDLLDEAKKLAASRTSLTPNRILISATHTHTAPSSMGALGTDADESYTPLLRQKIVEALVAAEASMQPAEVGWGSGDAGKFTALRRWVRRPDRIENDPFGNPTVRANMHAGRIPENAIGPTGPEDPELSMISFRTLQDHLPIAVLSNFSMHYFGDKAISADYFGLYCAGLQEFMVAGLAPKQPVVAIMSHGCSGDIWKRDYMLPATDQEPTLETYTAGLLAIAKKTYSSIEYRSGADLKMAERRLPMRYRVPDAQRLEWAKGVMKEVGSRPPKTNPEVYAREQILLDQLQSTEIVLQALRIGDIVIATTPNETYALTGLKLKLQSPLEKTMVIELANGGDGYIPPPEQHFLGGYNTWAARTAGLEVTAEPRIVAADLQLLEEVAGKPRRRFEQTLGRFAKSILQTMPLAYWRLNEFAPPIALDISGNDHQATYEPGVLFFLEGDDSTAFSNEQQPNRCAHFAGGRMWSKLQSLGNEFTLIMSFWNGMPLDGREISGWMFSRDHQDITTPNGIHLGLGGKENHAGQLLLQIGKHLSKPGTTVVPRWTWNQIALICKSNDAQVYLNGKLEIELSREPQTLDVIPSMFFGGRSDGNANWEGKLDEIALFDRAISSDELKELGVDLTWRSKSGKR